MEKLGNSMNRILFHWSLRSFLVFCAVISCALGGLSLRNQWRQQLFAGLQSVGNREGSPLRVTYSVEGRWFGLFGSDLSKLKGPTKKRWWFDPQAHRYVDQLTFYVADVPAPAAIESILGNRESLRGLETLGIYGNDKATPLPFPKPVARLPDIRFLRMSNIAMNRRDFESIARMPDLELLSLQNCQFELVDLKGLESSRHLAWLILSMKQEPDPDGLREIRQSLSGVYVSRFQCY